MKVESVWNDSEDLKNAVWGWADRIGVEVREVHLRDMRTEVGIHIDKWTVDPQHRPARPTGSVGRICHRP